MKNPYQKIGAGLLVAAGVLGLISWFYPAWIALGITGVITLGCAIRNELGTPTRTVSQWIQGLTTNKAIDYIIGVAIIAVASLVFFEKYGFEGGMEIAFWPLVCGLSLHFFANED